MVEFIQIYAADKRYDNWRIYVWQIQDLMEVTHLQGLPNLQILWLCDNPCVGSSASDYRKRTIAMLRKSLS